MFNPSASNPWVRRLPTQRSKATESSCGVERAAKKRSETWCPQSSLCRSRVVGLRELSFGPNRVARARFFRKVERRPRARGHVASPARLFSPTYRRPVNDAALPHLPSVAGAMITRFLYSPVVSWETLASHPAGDGFPSGQDCPCHFVRRCLRLEGRGAWELPERQQRRERRGNRATMAADGGKMTLERAMAELEASKTVKSRAHNTLQKTNRQFGPLRLIY